MTWRWGLAAVVVGWPVAAFAYGVAVERRAYTLRRVSLPLLAPGSPPWTILHLSDLHLTRRDRRLVTWLRRLGELEPDLVVSTGDNVAEARALPVLATALDPLFQYPGVFVFGSNDRYRAIRKTPWAYFLGRRRIPAGDRTLPTAALHELLTSAGWHDVEERRVVLDLPGGPVEVRGTGDAHIGRDRYARVAGPPDPTARLALGVTHSPYRHVLDAMTADGVDLILAGHTHGGQVCLPGFGALTTNCDLDRRRAKGLSRWEVGGATRSLGPAATRPDHGGGGAGSVDGCQWSSSDHERARGVSDHEGGRADTAHEPRRSALHVSAGLGTSPYAPYRFACRPEATLLTLVPRG